MLSPVRYAISMSHLSLPGSSAWSSHFSISHTTTAVKRLLYAYTSPSTALNQNVSEKVYARAPVMALASTATNCARVRISPFSPTSLRAKWLMVQNRNMMQAALKSALIVLTMRATMVGSSTSCVKRLAVSMKKGAPGGCPTSSLYAVVMNSGQSQKLAVGSIVLQYTKAAMANAIQPIRLSTSLNCFIGSVELFYLFIYK